MRLIDPTFAIFIGCFATARCQFETFLQGGFNDNEISELSDLLRMVDSDSVSKDELKELMKTLGVDASEEEIETIAYAEQLSQFQEIIQQLREDGNPLTEDIVIELIERLGLHLTQKEIATIVNIDLACPNIFEDSALFKAIENSRLDLLECYLKKDTRKHDLRDSDGATLLIWASFKGNLDIVKMLVDEGHQVDDVDNLGLNALSYSATQGLDLIISYLVGIGANVNLTDKEGNTALIWAVRSGSVKSVSTLIKNCANPGIRNKNNGDAYSEANRLENNAILTLLKAIPSNCIYNDEEDEQDL